MWVCLSVCCAMADEFEESATATARAAMVLEKRDADVRIKFCNGEEGVYVCVFIERYRYVIVCESSSFLNVLRYI